MAAWDGILQEISSTPGQQDIVRRKYIAELKEYTGRNVIIYYSGWLGKSGTILGLDIDDQDMQGFMNALKGMDCTKGLDLVLHTPGGNPAAAEAIVKYLRCKFDKDIRVIVPQLAMSAGTMIACSAKEIIMGLHSSLGPIDPQFSGIPAYNIMSEFEEAKKDLESNPKNIGYWQIKLSKFPAAFTKQAIDAIHLSDLLVTEWLGSCMYDSDKPEDVVKVKKIVEALNEHNNSKVHGRHFPIDFCQGIGLKIAPLEQDQKLQDVVLSLHHATLITLDASPVVKIIESSAGKCMIRNHIANN